LGHACCVITERIPLTVFTCNSPLSDYCAHDMLHCAAVATIFWDM
jgi:hypothetical protein